MLYFTRDCDERKTEQMAVWIESFKEQNREQFTPVLDIVSKSQMYIINANTETTKQFSKIILMTFSRLETATDLALTGRYDSASILLRASIEGVLRLTLDAINRFSDQLQQIDELADRCWKQKWEAWEGRPENSQPNKWRDALRDERAHAIGDMCTSLDFMGLTRGLTNKKGRASTYFYLCINDLNYITHSNLKPMEESDANILYSEQRFAFKQEKFEKFFMHMSRAVETILIIWQNLLDQIEERADSILVPGKQFDELKFPKLAKLYRIRGDES